MNRFKNERERRRIYLGIKERERLRKGQTERVTRAKRILGIRGTGERKMCALRPGL